MRFFAGYDRMYLRVAMPSAFEGVFMVLLSSVDIIMVGTLGLEAIAAVSIFTQPRMMLLCVTRSLASAVTLLTARLFGRGEHAPQARMFCQSLTFGAVVLGLLHINPGAAGKAGFHEVRTLVRFVIDGQEIKDLEVIELNDQEKLVVPLI